MAKEIKIAMEEIRVQLEANARAYVDQILEIEKERFGALLRIAVVNAAQRPDKGNNWVTVSLDHIAEEFAKVVEQEPRV